MANTANYMFPFRLCKKFHLVLIRKRNQHRVETDDALLICITGIIPGGEKDR